MPILMKRWRTIVYLAVAALLVLGFGYLGVTREFTTGLDIGFVIVVCIFVFIAVNIGLVKGQPQARLPLTNLHAKFEVRSLVRALACAALAIVWAAFAGWVLRGSQFNDSWIGVAFAFGPSLGLLGLFVKFLTDGFKITVGRR
jgi:hypothetical protein